MQCYTSHIQQTYGIYSSLLCQLGEKLILLHLHSIDENAIQDIFIHHLDLHTILINYLYPKKLTNAISKALLHSSLFLYNLSKTRRLNSLYKQDYLPFISFHQFVYFFYSCSPLSDYQSLCELYSYGIPVDKASFIISKLKHHLPRAVFNGKYNCNLHKQLIRKLRVEEVEDEMKENNTQSFFEMHPLNNMHFGMAKSKLEEHIHVQIDVEEFNRLLIENDYIADTKIISLEAEDKRDELSAVTSQLNKLSLENTNLLELNDLNVEKIEELSLENAALLDFKQGVEHLLQKLNEKVLDMKQVQVQDVVVTQEEKVPAEAEQDVPVEAEEEKAQVEEEDEKAQEVKVQEVKLQKEAVEEKVQHINLFSPPKEEQTEVDDNTVECCICLEPFSNPHSIVCCQICRRKVCRRCVVRSGTLVCPLCRTGDIQIRLNKFEMKELKKSQKELNLYLTEEQIQTDSELARELQQEN